MAEQLTEFTREARSGPDPTYPWDEWLGGGIWRLTEGEDYKCDRTSMIDLIRKTTAKRKTKVSVFQAEDPRGLVIQPRVEGSGPEEATESPQKPRKKKKVQRPRR